MINERIVQARKQKRLKQTDLAKLLNVSIDTVRRWEQGKRAPTVDKLQPLANALDTTISYLTGDIDIPEHLPPAQAPASEDVHVVRVPDKLVKIKVLSFAACMGNGFDNEGEAVDIIDELLLPIGDVGVMGPEEPFAVEVQGQSMSPTIEDGVRVIVNPNIKPGRGEVCMARFLARGYLRDAIKFYHPTPDGGVILKSSEKSGVPPMEFTAKEVNDGDVKIVGRVMSYNITVRL